ncbi:MAG: DUF2079 domain-containing protein [Bifidobacteriaceae bacterium]|nr:DUF2079 domain-containing protein [Bifidobacteriaceae bacterium]
MTALIGFGLYLVLALARWGRQDAPSLDLAIFEQAVKGYAELGWPMVDIKGPGANQLGDHFSPVLALLAPFYKLFPSPVTLLVAQCLLVALSIAPIAAIARRRLGAWPGGALGGAYALSWGLQTGVDVQFHEYAFAVPMLAFALAAAIDRRWTAAGWWIAATLSVKEDLSLTVVAFGGVMAAHGWWRLREARRPRPLPPGSASAPAPTHAEHPPAAAAPAEPEPGLPGQPVGIGPEPEPGLPGQPVGIGPEPEPGLAGPADDPRRSADSAVPADVWRAECRAGLVLASVGLAVALVVFELIMPAFKGAGWFYWDKLDQTGGALGVVVGILSPPVKLKTLALVSAVVMGACWFSRWSLVAAPTLIWRFASTDPAHWGTGWHYSMILMPVVFLAAVDALGRWRASKRRWLRAVAPAVAWAAAVFALAACAWFPLGDLAKPEAYRASPRADQAAAVIAAIPPGASVASDRGLITRLVSEHTVYWIGDFAELVQPDYVVLDPSSGWSGDPGSAEAYAEAVYGGDYEPVAGIGQPDDQDSFRLARRVG